MNSPLPSRADVSTAGRGATVAVPGLMDPEHWVDDHGDYLYQYAFSRLRDPIRAEDFVQETLLAALKSHERFQGRSTERGWLTGILKHKILDHFRKAGREISFTDLNFYLAEEDQTFDHQGMAGHWVADQAPSDWTRTGEPMDRGAFWEALDRCTGKLPRRHAQVFLLREVDQLPGEEICSILNISPNNLSVMLHRARLALRHCLDISWFGKAAPTKD